MFEKREKLVKTFDHNLAFDSVSHSTKFTLEGSEWVRFLQCYRVGVFYSFFGELSLIMQIYRKRTKNNVRAQFPWLKYEVCLSVIQQTSVFLPSALKWSNSTVVPRLQLLQESTLSGWSPGRLKSTLWKLGVAIEEREERDNEFWHLNFFFSKPSLILVWWFCFEVP